MSDPRLAELQAAHVHFLSMVEALRPALHRYCSRMMGSVIEGEDVVQETLAHAYYELSQLRQLPALRGWLFRIAHNRSLNLLAARARRSENAPLVEAREPAAEALNADAALERAEAIDCAIGLFVQLPSVQRACVILKDVLDSSLDEVAETLEMSVPAVKAALHRGRARLAEARKTQSAWVPAAHSPEVVRYVALFNEHDWDGVRAMLAEDVRLELVSREKRRGLTDVSSYFTNYGRSRDWQMASAWMDGQEVVAVFRRQPDDARPAYVIQLSFEAGRVQAIRDYRYVSYLVEPATFDVESASPAADERAK